jgi:hypothetical protein
MKKFVFLLVICLLALSATTWAADESVNYSGDDLAQWHHPVKAVFTQNNVNLLEVDLENKVNFSFAVEFVKDLTVDNEAYFDTLIRAVAKEVKFNSFEITDDAKEIMINVTCEKGAVAQIVYNDNPNYFNDLKVFAAKEKQLRELLLKNVPELATLEKMVLKNSDGKAKMVISISTQPDPTASDKYDKEYYLMVIDKVQGDDRQTLDQFVIHQDTNQILWNDGEKYITLAEWREASIKEPYWPNLFINN